MHDRLVSIKNTKETLINGSLLIQEELKRNSFAEVLQVLVK